MNNVHVDKHIFKEHLLAGRLGGTAGADGVCHLQLNRKLARGCSPRSLQLNAKNFCNEIVDFAVKS
jgi:hypothetical protein